MAVTTRGNASGGWAPRRLPYVLIAVADVARAAWCLDGVRPFRQGALIARDGDEALAILQRFGPPTLLISDISLPRQDGFRVMEALRADQDIAPPIIALSPFRALRSYARRRSDLRITAVLSSSSPLEILRDAVERALHDAERRAAAGEARPEGATRASEALIDRTMRETVEAAVRVSGARGAAVYLQLDSEARLRAHVTWISKTADAGSPIAPPQLLEWVQQAREAVLLPDLADQPFVLQPSSPFRDVVRGVAAAPIMSGDGTVIGAVCVFDVNPLRMRQVELDALKGLGEELTRILA